MDVSNQGSLKHSAFVQLCISGKIVEEFEIRSPVVSLGRSEDCDIVIDNVAISGFHAVLSQRGGKLLIEEADSSIGITAGGLKKPAVELEPGESVDIAGTYSMRLVRAPAGRATRIFRTRASSEDEQRSALLVDTATLARLSQGVSPAYLTLETDKRDTWILRLDTLSISIGGSRSADIRIGGWFTPASIAAVECRVDGYYLVVEPGREMEVDGRRIVDEARLTDGTRFRVRELGGVFHERAGIPH